jgi:hypothetical protein
LITLRRAVPSQSWRVSQYFDRAAEQQHRSMRNVHSWSFRSRVPARPALPDRRVSARRRGRACSESRECCAKGRLFSSLVDTIRIMGKGDTHIHVEAWWAVANEIPPISMRPEQPSRCVRVCSGSDLRHVCSLAQHPPATNAQVAKKRAPRPRSAVA